MSMWHRFLVWVGIRKPCIPHNRTKEQVAVDPLPEVAGHPAVFRDNPPERGPLDLPRPTARRVAPPPRYGGTPSDRRVRTPNANARSAVGNASQHRHTESNDLLDGLTALVLANALLSDDASGTGKDSGTSELANTGNSGVPESTVIDPVPSTRFDSSSTTRFDSSETTKFSGGESESNWLGDAVSSIGDAVSSVFDD